MSTSPALSTSDVMYILSYALTACGVLYPHELLTS